MSWIELTYWNPKEESVLVIRAYFNRIECFYKGKRLFIHAYSHEFLKGFQEGIEERGYVFMRSIGEDHCQ